MTDDEPFWLDGQALVGPNADQRTYPKCPARGCPARYRDGPDRACGDHINDLYTREQTRYRVPYPSERT